jgi:RNA polymerase sigma-70 factor (ECF subfamily)
MEDRAVRDRRLVHSILRGDEDGFAVLVARYQSLVASVAWRYGIRGADVEDLVSEVFVKVFRQLHRYREEHAFSTWLYRLAANHVIDHGRRVRREGVRVEMPSQPADSAQDAQRGIEARERIELLRAALDDVSEPYRAVLFLVYVEGMKLDEAARTLGLRQGTIKTRLMRGRAALRKILVRRHPEHFGG